jgi:hypothetical protein
LNAALSNAAQQQKNASPAYEALNAEFLNQVYCDEQLKIFTVLQAVDMK